MGSIAPGGVLVAHFEILLTLGPVLETARYADIERQMPTTAKSVEYAESWGRGGRARRALSPAQSLRPNRLVGGAAVTGSVFDVDLGAPHRVTDLLGALGAVFADDNLFANECILGDDGLLGSLP